MIDYAEYTGYKNADPEQVRSDLRAMNGVRITEALFEETIQRSSKGKFEPKYTLKEYEVNGKPSAYQIYMHSIDETDAALKLVGSMAHWSKLCKLHWFIYGREDIGFDGLLQWRKDMLYRDRSFAKKVLLDNAKRGVATAAAQLDRWAREDFKLLAKDQPVKSKQNEDDNIVGLDFLDNLGTGV